MERASGFLLDVMLAVLIAILAFVALRKVLLPSKKQSFFEEARELLAKRIDLKEDLEGLKRQFTSGELDSRHYKAALNHQLQELTVIERKIKRFGFA